MSNALEVSKRIEMILKSNLRQMPKDESEKILDSIWKFVGDAIIKRSSQKEICAEAGRLINRVFPFSEISIALKDPRTSRFKFESVIGFRAEVEKELRNRSYTEEEACSHDRDPYIKIDDFLDFELAEGTPRNQNRQETLEYNRPAKLQEERKSADEMKEGDYIVLYFHGTNGAILGYAELESPRNRKLPSGTVLKWLEIFGMLMGVLLQSSKYEK